MKKRIHLVFVASVLILFFACDTTPIFEPGGGYKYSGKLPLAPINLTEFNSPFDDYNSSSPILGDIYALCFSTNRPFVTQGFDIIYQPMNIIFDRNTGEFTVTNQSSAFNVFRKEYEVLRTGLSKTSTAGNELGPNLSIDRNMDDYIFTLMYSTDVSGDAQINFISNATHKNFSEAQEVVFLNSPHDDLYPTFTTDLSNIYFCSNRSEEEFDLYYTAVNKEMTLEEILLNKAEHAIEKDFVLSSPFDDKCPFIHENRLVFASNRAGGFGGFDLYYSDFKNGQWTAPTNFGETINTRFDEYRPILIDEKVTPKQTMMIFSSNRTGGKGGFNLYYVGIDNE